MFQVERRGNRVFHTTQRRDADGQPICTSEAEVSIAVGAGSAYELYLSRTIRHAEIVRAPTGPEAWQRFETEQLEVAAGVKSPLQRYAAQHGFRVMDGRFMVIEQAMGVPRGRTAARDYLQSLLEELKASGFVARALEQSGQRDARVAPPA